MLTPRIALLLVALAVILAPWLVWQIPAVRRVAPLAVLQIVAGVLLGPSGFGRIAPGAFQTVFSPAAMGQLTGLATVGVLLYVLVSGLHLDAAGVRDGLRRLGPAALGSIAVPFALGLAAGWWMLGHVPGAIGPAGGAPAFLVCVAICLSVTALPVLAAILREMGLIETRLGQTALAIAAFNDAALWLMVAVLLALAHGSAADAAATVGWAVAWFAAMLALVRPALAALAHRMAPEAMLVAVAAAALASAAAADAIGVGYVTGAFMAGAVVPAAARRGLLAVLEPLTAAVLLPFFFALTGLRAFIEPASGVFAGVLAVCTLATIVGKVAGAALPARATGASWPDALALGSLMQAKGLMEVLVLAILADAGLVGPAVFSAFVAMAVVCTVITVPLTRLALGLRGKRLLNPA